MMDAVILEILSPLPLTKREDGQRIFELWKVHLPELLPDFYGNWEPIDRVFNPQGIDAVLDQWKWPFLATKATPFVDAQVWMRKGLRQQKHATLIFRIDPVAAKQEQLLAFLKSVSTALRADFACIHLATPAELERGKKNNTVLYLDKRGKRLSFLLLNKDLQQRLPELYWATLFGGCYSEMFGRDCLLTTPGFSVEALPHDAVLLQLTENLTDVGNSAALFEDARDRAKAHLGQEAFFQPDAAEGHVYRVPHFEFA
jgi:hypothetical protein